MSYCTQADLIEQFSQQELVQLTDRDGTGQIGTEIVTQAIDQAGSRIDGYCRGRFALPLNPVDNIIRAIACDITRYRLYKDSAPELVTERYNQAITDLKAIGKGTLTISAVAPAKEAATDIPMVEAYPRIFSEDTLEDY